MGLEPLTCSKRIKTTMSAMTSATKLFSAEGETMSSSSGSPGDPRWSSCNYNLYIYIGWSKKMSIKFHFKISCMLMLIFFSFLTAKYSDKASCEKAKGVKL